MQYLDLNTQVIVDDALQRLNEYTNLTFLSPGSKARLLVEVLGEEIGREAEEFDRNTGAALIRGASGVLLDYIGEIYGLPRLQEEKAEVFSQEENFSFYTLEPNFGELNNGDDIIIGVGAVSLFNTNTVSPEQVVYKNTEEIVLSKNENRVFFGAEAAGAGENSNIGAASLVFHDFSNYTDSLSNTLLTSNSQSIVYGRDQESDENYRYRIQKEKISAEAGNETAIRLNILLVPGVSNIVRIPYSRGIGTTDWLIKSTSTLVSGQLVDTVQQSIDQKQSSGTSNIAKSPNIIGLEVKFPITYKTSLEDSDKEKIKAEVRKNVSDYVNNLEIGESLIVDQVVKVVLNSSDEIESMGDPNSSENFSSIFIYKRSGLSTSVIRKSLTSDYRTKQYERVILEPGVQTPIVIRDNN
jgi:uncharacterized phage protein gp47/JayE